MTSPANLVETFSKRMREIILPFWASQGFDLVAGQFGERTDLEGMLVRDVPHRAMVQARQIYVYSDAERTGAAGGCGERALRALDALLTRYSYEGDLRKGLAFSASLDGTIVSSVRDTYTHAFVLFALASAFRLTRETKLLRAVAALVEFIDGYLADDHAGGFFERYPHPETFKRQNPLMHMLEAYLALNEAFPDGGFLDRATKVVRLFRERLFQADLGVVFEIYQENWSAIERAPDSSYEPGHQFEWAWLLNEYDKLSGSENSALGERLWEAACISQSTPPFLCPDAVAVDPTLTKYTSRVWPHTEGIKAAACRDQHGTSGASIVLGRQIRVLDSFFLGRPFPAGWMDRVDAVGAPTADMVPASTLYHLYTAFRELSRCGGNGAQLRDHYAPRANGKQARTC